MTTPAIEAFLQGETPPTPFLVTDLDVVADGYRSLVRTLPGVEICDAVKAKGHRRPYLRFRRRDLREVGVPATDVFAGRGPTGPAGCRSYIHSYSTVGFNGFPPLTQHFVGRVAA